MLWPGNILRSGQHGLMIQRRDIILTPLFTGILMPWMRTTLTVDPDVERLLRQAMHGEKQGLKATLNAALRRGLAHQLPPLAVKPFVVEAKSMGLRAGLDPARLHDLADDLELAAFAATTRRLRRATR
jgi:hypothetical protein